MSSCEDSYTRPEYQRQSALFDPVLGLQPGTTLKVDWPCLKRGRLVEMTEGALRYRDWALA